MRTTAPSPTRVWSPLPPRTILFILLGTDLALFIAHVVGSSLIWVPQPSDLRNRISILTDMGGEPTIPTWFAIAQLLATAALFTAIGIQARQAGRPAVPWFVFAGIVAYISVDEQAHIHEQLVEPVRQLFGITSGPFVLAWVIPALILVAIVGALSIGFVLRQPVRTRVGILVAGVVFVFGAVVMEMVDAMTYEYLATLDETGSRIKRIMYGVEELLELVAISILIATLVAHLGARADAAGQNASATTATPSATSSAPASM